MSTTTTTNNNNNDKTIRLLMPQWQGGNNPLYYLGAQLLNVLAPPSDTDRTITVPVAPPPSGDDDARLETVEGVVGKPAVVAQARAAAAIVAAEDPARVAVLGGDCLVELAPFAHLAHRYRPGTTFQSSSSRSSNSNNESTTTREVRFGILWIDAHPDILDETQFQHSHTYVLGLLMGHGSRELREAGRVRSPVRANRVFVAGLEDMMPHEAQFLQKHAVPHCSGREIKATGAARVREWVAAEGITHLAIHLDIDVVDPRSFGATLMAEPMQAPGKYDGVGHGVLLPSEVAALVRDAAAAVAEVVGFGLTEHLPWDMRQLQRWMASFPVLGRRGGNNDGGHAAAPLNSSKL